VITFARDVWGLSCSLAAVGADHMLELLPTARTVPPLIDAGGAAERHKTTLMQVLALWRIVTVDGASLMIARRRTSDVAERAWTGAVEMAEGSPARGESRRWTARTARKRCVSTRGTVQGRRASRRGGRGCP